jgi:RimJ/RimL family protein N-acetyltransferase
VTPIWTSEGHPAHALHWQWASAKLFGNLRGFGPCTTMGVVHDGGLVGVMVFHNFDRESGVIEISGVSETPRWVTRRVLEAMFSYPFDQLGCQLVVMRVSERDERLPRILTAYGFESFYIPRLRGRGEGENIFTLTDDAWRVNGFHRKSLPVSPPAEESAAAA